MIKEEIDGVEIFFDKEYIVERNIIRENYSQLSNIINNLWGLKKPEKFNIYITDSDIKYSLYAYSFIQKIMILIIFPYWYLKVRRSFKVIGVIDINLKVPSILIKSIKFLESTDASIGKLIYERTKNTKERYKHAYISLITAIKAYKIELSKWLGSGIGSMTREKFFSKQIIKKETIKMLDTEYSEKDPNNIDSPYPHVVGYWTVRYLEENHSGFLKETFKEYKGDEIVEQIRLKLGLDSDKFWQQLDELLYENYKYLLNN